MAATPHLTIAKQRQVLVVKLEQVFIQILGTLANREEIHSNEEINFRLLVVIITAKTHQISSKKSSNRSRQKMPIKTK